MTADEVRWLFDYSYGATFRVLASAHALTIEQYSAVPPLNGARSIQDTLVHMLDTEQGWRENLRARQSGASPVLAPEDYPDVNSLISAWRTDERRMRDWLGTLDDRAVNATAYNGRVLWQCLLHVINHSTQHRSEVAMALTHIGQSPGDLDLTYFLRGWSDAQIQQ